MRKTTLLLTMLFLGLFGTVHAADDSIIQWFFGNGSFFIWRCGKFWNYLLFQGCC